MTKTEDKSVQKAKTRPGLPTKSNVKAGGMPNHNQTLVRNGLRLKTKVKAGGITINHSQTALKQ